ncbi:MAG: DUF3459 domain-containing protein, partial [Chloroflexota bacterium]
PVRSYRFFLHDLLPPLRPAPVLPAPPSPRPPLSAVAGTSAVVATLTTTEGSVAIAVNFGRRPASLPLPGPAVLVIHSEEPRFGGGGPAPLVVAGELQLPPETGAFLRLRPG